MVAFASLNAAVLCIALAWLARLALPLQQALRVRNAFLLRRGRAEDFSWTPAQVPPDFRVETLPAPAVIRNAVAESGALAVADDWQRALALVSMLVRHARRGGAVRADLSTTWREIVAGNGYCADYVRVYLAAASTAGLFCRQWAFSFDGFGGHGHTFVEVFDRQRSGWVFIDVHNNVYAVAAGSGMPLDAAMLRTALLEATPGVEFVRAGEGRLGYEHPHKLMEYFRNGVHEWYLWWGNDVVARSETGIARLLGRASGRLSHRLAGSLLDVPAMVVWPDEANEPAIRRMIALRRQVRVAVVAVLVPVTMLVLLVAWATGRSSDG